MRKLIISVLAIATATSAFAEKQDSIITGTAMQDVVVTGTRKAVSLRNLPNTVSTVSRETLTENQRLNILPTLTEQIPGLFSTQRGVMGYGVSGGAAGGMMLRGISSGGGQVMVLIDGQPQYQGVFGHSINDSYQTMIAERVEVMRGPASLLYGSNAMGGVINIITRKNYHAKENEWTLNLGAGSYGTFQAEIGHQWQKNRFSSSFGVNYSRSDNHRPNMGFEQYGFFEKINYDINPNWNAFADINLTHFNSSYPGAESAPMLEADQWITRGAVALGVENHYDKTSGRISIYDNFGIHKINDGYVIATGKPQTELFRSKDALMGISWYETMNLIQGNSITVGMDYQHIYGRAYYTSRETGEIVTTGKRGMQSTHAHSNEVAGYVDVRQDLTSFLTLDAGIRFDHHSVAGNEWVPQFGLVVRPTGNGELKLTVSKGFRNPTTKDLYLYAVANHDSLRAERMWNYEIAWHQSLCDNRLRYGVNLFSIKADNIIQAVNGRNINTGELKNKGVELEASYIINKHWSLNTNHSYLHMKNPVVGAPTYKGYLGANTHYGKWSATIGAMLVNGLYTQVGNNETKENFTLVNATVNYSLCHNLRLWVKGENLLAQKYEYVLGYPMPRATFMAGINVNI